MVPLSPRAVDQYWPPFRSWLRLTDWTGSQPALPPFLCLAGPRRSSRCRFPGLYTAPFVFTWPTYGCRPFRFFATRRENLGSPGYDAFGSSLFYRLLFHFSWNSFFLVGLCFFLKHRRRLFEWGTLTSIKHWKAFADFDHPPFIFFLDFTVLNFRASPFFGFDPPGAAVKRLRNGGTAICRPNFPVLRPPPLLFSFPVADSFAKFSPPPPSFFYTPLFAHALAYFPSGLLSRCPFPTWCSSRWPSRALRSTLPRFFRV